MKDVIFDDEVKVITRRERIPLQKESWKPYAILVVGTFIIFIGLIGYYFRAQQPSLSVQETRFLEWMNQGNTGAPPDYFMPNGVE